MAVTRSGRGSRNSNPKARALKGLHEYQRTINTVCNWRFVERFSVAYFIVMKGLPIRAVLLYAFIWLIKIPRNKHKRPLMLAAIMLFLLVQLYFTYHT